MEEETVEGTLCTPQRLESKPFLDRTAEPIDLTGQVVRKSEFPEHGGSYADIYFGYWYPKDEKPSIVAVKVIRTHIYKDSTRNKVQKRLRREIRIWACLKHPNVIPLLGTVTDFGRGVLSMGVLSMVCPWMGEGDLAGYLVRKGDHLTQRNRLQICQDIANGLEYIHSRQVVHRDLTTANILIDSNPVIAKLSDFGLSNVIAELQSSSFMTSKITGSARWAAPELFSPDGSIPLEPNFTTDVYSLGSVIFHVMSGKVPYDGLTETQVMLKIMSNQHPTPITFNMDSTVGCDGVRHIIKLCWETVPPSRPTVAEVGQMIAILHSE
ncbi:hypothetical protein HYPSUDRAFT_47229 [Hypholoma sublateritium FD-334 SS-4]|uniref:Protein kinase domain-containing protein n=1 Tax=Hypholoma sublateritium (strain FD-334 SS-4) TaxID=945553 RepID=A0A0D2KPQ8_HYPSF|nr:hypothetical protein HYPSUDRAFT_47229 [Hypholoma sublateritium FD-334 SS-4]